MRLRTFLSLVGTGRLAVLLSTLRLVRAHHRIAFLASGLSSGILERLARKPASASELASELGVEPTMRDGLEAWLELGVAVGELRLGADGYRVRGRLAKKLLEPANGATAAVVEEVAFLHTPVIAHTPERVRRARRFTLADQDARMIARSSRVAEPLIREAMDAVVPRHGPLRLLEIGCGAAAYIRHAAERNPELTALGVELQPRAAALAAENVAAWNLAPRVAIETGDILQRRPEPVFDVATLHQNIYYFPVDGRVAALRHVRGFLKPGGRLVLTTACRGRTPASAILGLWAAMTEGCGRLPAADELVAQLRDAGFVEVTSRKLVAGELFYAFVGASPGPG